MTDEEHEEITRYWLDHYVGDDRLCVLCKNKGIIKLKDRAKHFCICPNGQSMRYHYAKEE